MQKGLAPILIVLVLAGVIALVGGGYYLGTKRSETLQERVDKQNQVAPFITPSQTPALTTSTDWKTLKFSDSSGFGYEIKIPSDWRNISWGGGHTNPEPAELAQNFFGNNCGIGKDDRIDILHFKENNPKESFNKIVEDFKKQNPTVDRIRIEGQIVEKYAINVIGYDDFYVFLISDKGHYEIFGRAECTEDFEKNFDAILSTFKQID